MILKCSTNYQSSLTTMYFRILLWLFLQMHFYLVPHISIFKFNFCFLYFFLQISSSQENEYRLDPVLFKYMLQLLYKNNVGLILLLVISQYQQAYKYKLSNAIRYDHSLYFE